MKLKLLTAPSQLAEEDNPDNFHPNNGLATISSFLESKRIHVDQIDLFLNLHHKKLFYPSERINFKILNDEKNYSYLDLPFDQSNKNFYLIRTVDKILREIDITKNDIFGFSVVFKDQLLPTLILAKRIKELKNTVVIGGPLVTLLPKSMIEYLLNLNFIDYIIRGDGEIPLLKLVDFLKGKLKINEIPNLVYKNKKGEIIFNSFQNFDINQKSLPIFKKSDIQKYKDIQKKKNGKPVLFYQVNKGCKNRCSFCSYCKISKIALKDPEKIVSDLKFLISRHGINNFYFTDNLVNLSYKHLDEICNKIIENEIKIQWFAMARADNIDKKIAVKMHDSGCKRLVFGIESGSPEILKDMNKNITIEQIENVFSNLTNAGMNSDVNLIVGYPHETQEDMKKTIDFVKRNKNHIQKVIINRFLLEPNSDIAMFPEKYSITLETEKNSYYYQFAEIGGLSKIEKDVQTQNFMKDMANELGKDGIYVRVLG